ncbi:DNA-directed RNA polymerase III subunit RPC4-like [Impatiens glandulifera]|uniref:DNA-directed RNA polymerase III subunit RPC4-like n=1 Tax=Impatiens glandulifera TaxID=253017 RepID=UPI001FB16681|nr:DNA-directed RNA polymerase III subunit RPC4-like [Impatiens glandulifera]XP_047318256.1 DNA-directed RNA polymerase III subunit RPC4-like [Impatiens glandulifera]
MNPNSGDNKSGQKQKVRFAPKAPKKLLKPVVPKVEKVEAVDSDEAHAQELLRRFNESKSRAKTEKKGTNVQVAFGFGGTTSSFRSSGSSKKSENTSSGGALKTEKEYIEPWDYYSNYPACLPLRRPYSGNPERLNEEEFGEASRTSRINENTPSNAATDLGLMDENPETKLLLMQLPSFMPTLNNSQSSAASSSSSKAESSEKTCKLNDLPAGYMGKLLVYESGAVKLKLGETIFDVYEGMKTSFAQEAVAVNTKTAQSCSIGELNKVAIVVPDVEFILDSMAKSNLSS